MSGNLAAVLASARRDLGYTEGPGNNENKYSTFWKHPSEPWCADAAAFHLNAGKALDVAWSAYTPTFAEAFRKVGRWGSAPRMGAVVFFQWPGMGRIAHVGIVEAVRPDGSIVTLEGNTDVAGGRTGGRFMRKVRRANVAGYGYPRYDPPVKAAPKPPPTLKQGATGQAVLAAQRLLNKHGAHVAEDGQFGPATNKAVRVFQQARHMPGTGVIDGPTWAALRRP